MLCLQAFKVTLWARSRLPRGVSETINWSYVSPGPGEWVIVISAVSSLNQRLLKKKKLLSNTLPVTPWTKCNSPSDNDCPSSSPSSSSCSSVTHGSGFTSGCFDFWFARNQNDSIYVDDCINDILALYKPKWLYLMCPLLYKQYNSVQPFKIYCLYVHIFIVHSLCIKST